MKSQQYKKSNKIDKSEKKTSRGTVSMNMCTKFSADWNIFRYRSGSTLLLSQTQEISNIFVIGHFVVQKVWKAYKKIFRPIGWKKLWKFVYHSTSFGRITFKISTSTWHISSFHWGSKSNLNMSWVYMKQ